MSTACKTNIANWFTCRVDCGVICSKFTRFEDFLTLALRFYRTANEWVIFLSFFSRGWHELCLIILWRHMTYAISDRKFPALINVMVGVGGDIFVICRHFEVEFFWKQLACGTVYFLLLPNDLIVIFMIWIFFDMPVFRVDNSNTSLFARHRLAAIFEYF